MIARIRLAGDAMTGETRGALGMVTAMLLFICMDSIAKHLGETVQPMQVVWARYVGQTLLLFAIFLPSLPQRMRTAAPGLQILRSVLVFGATSMFFTALTMMELAEATALMEVAPLLITVFAALILRERVGPRRWTAVAIGLVGALVIIRPGLDVFQTAAILPLMAATCLAAFQIATRLMGAADSIWTTMLYTTLFGSVASTIVMLFLWETPPIEALPFMAVMGVFGFGGHLCLVWALGQAPASVLAPFNYSQLVWSVLIGYVVFMETPDTMTLLGAGIIVGAGLYVWHRERVRALPADAPPPG